MSLKDAFVVVFCLMGAVACASRGTRYPGTADVRAGAPPVIEIEPTGSTEASPRTLKVPPGTEVVFRNAGEGQVFIRFEQPIRQVCGTPVGFDRSSDGQSFVSRYLPPFAEARLCFAGPGRYDFVASRQEAPGPRGFGLPDQERESPVVYGTVLVG